MGEIPCSKTWKSGCLLKSTWMRNCGAVVSMEGNVSDIHDTVFISLGGKRTNKLLISKQLCLLKVQLAVGKQKGL